jgi:hypothetical protein
MKRRRLYLWTFLLTAAAGWAGAHFTVGNAGSVALRAVVSEGRMAFASEDKESAAARVASLTGKSAPDMAAVIAGWWQLTSVAEIRHLFAALDKVPDKFRASARDILLGRWAMLDPDSLILAGLRESDFNKRVFYLGALCRHWAAGRSPEDVADLLHSTLGDLRKFIPEPRAGGYYQPGNELLLGRAMLHHLGMDPRMALEVARRLDYPIPPEGCAAIFSALAKLDPAEAQRRLIEITDPAARRAAEAGIASQLALTNPQAALALCDKGGPGMAASVAPAYFQHLLSLPAAEAWQKAGEFVDRFDVSINKVLPLLERLTLRDPAGIFRWMEDRPASQRKAAEWVIGHAEGPGMQDAMQRYLATASPQSAEMAVLVGSVLHHEDAKLQSTVEWARTNATPDIQIAVANAALRTSHSPESSLDLATTAKALEMQHAVQLSPETRELLIHEGMTDRLPDYVSNTVARNWPESAGFLDQLSPAAREAALPGFMQGAAQQDPAQAAQIFAVQPESAATPEAAAALAKEWAEYDLDAARQWAQTLSGEARTRAEAAMKEAAASWSR